MTGYLHRAYAEALSEFGTPTWLSGCNGWILKRAIAGSAYSDAMGLYPLFCCERWKNIAQDICSLQGQLVSLVLVADPFGEYSVPDLQAAFHFVRAFKEHFVVDPCAPLDVSKHHRYYARRALKSVTIEMAETAAAFSEEFSDLYDVLIRRHRLSGLRAFSRNSIALQLRVPGAVLFRAVDQGTTVGAHLWMVQNDIAYSHLLAMSPRGYETAASYGLYAEAIEYFRGKVRWLDLGSGAGAGETENNSLVMFKGGWSNAQRATFLCGAILDEGEYKRLSPTTIGSYFPIYRNAELISTGGSMAKDSNA